ncbi:fluoride efflux transporter CrcB [Kitasatospora kifunensis]|uniref:Fluoride-specific ion channel FluC n=1 Tax=Kitasatospora kifunensis TaxID=58351 RepID=A0A7W7R2X1_KITKI|nr:fluoride efflux transporter CrcB [Kitasatospora kifunensis]MBB4924430.1 CrcB protein [Kitasatospora kifunensis]
MGGSSRVTERVPLDVVAVVALGGVLGAEARYGAGRVWSTAAEAFPWTTLTINVVGCLVIGVFLVAITEGRPAHRLVRPFFGTGVLGGFTTFSTYCVDVQRLLNHGQSAKAVGYLALTLAAALAAVAGGAGATRWVLRRGAGAR